jgi:hypothetical protein
MTYTPWIVEGKVPWHDQEFWEMPWRDAERFTKWFVESAPQRIGTIEELVRSTARFESWRADCSRESFVRLGPWLLETLTRRVPRADDVEKVRAQMTMLNPNLPKPIVEDLQSRPPELKWVFTDEPLARSVLTDIGTYLAECLRKMGPRCKWARCKDKRDMNFNHPLLLWPYEESVGYNPFHAPRKPFVWMTEDPRRTASFADVFDELRVLATFERREHVPVPQRVGKAMTTRCPKCGFGFARVFVQEGIYCNHCGHLDMVV